MSSPRIVAIVHVFYPEIWPELARCIHAMIDVCGEDHFALYVTYPESNPAVRDIVLRNFPQADLRGLPNRGYDVGPFIDTLNRMNLDDYDFVVKLHTKRDVEVYWSNFVPLLGNKWRRALLSFCDTPVHFRKTLATFSRVLDAGMIASRQVICEEFAFRDPSFVKVEREIRRFGVSMPKNPRYVAGTIFIVRAGLLKILWHKVDFGEFEIVDRPHLTHQLAHSYEGILSYLVLAQHFQILDWKMPWMFEKPYFGVRRQIFACLAWISFHLRKSFCGAAFDNCLLRMEGRGRFHR